MSESTQHNPNRSAKPTRRGRLAASAAVLSLAAGGSFLAADVVKKVNDKLDAHEEHGAMVTNLRNPDALKSYLAGTAFVGSNREKVVLVEADDTMPPDKFARILKKDNESQVDLKYQIMPQADGQGYPGVQAGEQFVLERDLLSEEAIETYVVPVPGEDQK